VKHLLLITVLLASCLTVFAQDPVSPEDKALLEKLSHDNSYIVIDRDKAKYVTEINSPKHKLYTAYLEKSPDIVKVFKRERAGWEGQYTMTWFTVESGKVKIVEAYFGDPSASGELQYVRVYTPKELMLGYLDKDGKFTPLLFGETTKNKELVIGYQIPSEERTKVF
jgi:hypothetical protein